MRKCACLLFLLLPFLVFGLKMEKLGARTINPEEAWNPRDDPPISESPILPDDPPGEKPPPAVSPACAGGPEEDFSLEEVRFTFYTPKRKDAGTQQPVYVTPLGGNLPEVTLL